MPRRRHRLFTVCAVIFVFLLYRLVQHSWGEQPDLTAARRPQPVAPPSALRAKLPAAIRPQEPLKEADSDSGAVNDADGSRLPPVGGGNGGGDERDHRNHHPPSADGSDGGSDKAGHTGSGKNNAGGENVVDDDGIPLSWKTPPKDAAPEPVPPAQRPIHWIKPKEHFPIPTQSLVPLPTGPAKKLPKVQFNFGPESQKAKDVRLQRQKKVKAELARSWAGYRKHAWMHDELSPDSGGFRDPFCGWSATLVDSLDTLWIAGLKKEFAEAAKAVKKIDFTYSPRSDIPVFETTIRYLGGLISAFDVSGGSHGDYSFLLDKAKELADILMGIFDTPNRMPILYYHWRPDYTSQPHMASRVGVAELATLTMEFTRLAQITGQDEYYDAVDRITDALVDLQKQGTLIPGLFPEALDASGCNKTATTMRDTLSKAAQAQVDSQEVLEQPVGFAGRQAKGVHSVLDSNRLNNRRKELGQTGIDASKASPANDHFKRATESTDKAKKRSGPLAADGKKAPWDCVPQGLVPSGSGFQKFHVGGGQDSAYEYFPKVYQLLGGREAKYQKLHEDAVDAIDKWLLFRPMIKGDWNVLIPAKLSVREGPTPNPMYEYEMAHLTCFVGGMYGLGGKLFDRPHDIETAKKLANACVWAYQSTLSGLMPEFGHVMPCASKDSYEFNTTRWWQELDPSKHWRDDLVARWDAEHGAAKADSAPIKGRAEGAESEVEGSSDNNARRSASDDVSRLSKRAVVPERDQDSSGETSLRDGETDSGSKLPASLREKLGAKGPGSDSSDAKKKEDDAEARAAKGSPERGASREPNERDSAQPGVSERPGLLSPKSEESQDTIRPQSHEEYVQARIQDEGMPPGFVSVGSAAYILRPEAIESVWYMYRVTGDAEWMDKGWQMFEATVRATRTAIANSAVDNVLSAQPSIKDEMESFWMAETLKYYLLLFSEPDIISLDEWVLNTEAHPFRL